MRIRWNWKSMGILAALIAVMITTQPLAAKNFRMDISKCPNQCRPDQICGVTQEVPKQCGPSPQGPWYGSTYSCCCCTENSKGNWFYGG